jgi:asparagine synthase (glutamine-hydrolysing)
VSPSFIVLSWHSSRGRERAEHLEHVFQLELVPVGRGPQSVVLAQAGAARSVIPGLVILGEAHRRKGGPHVQDAVSSGPIACLRALTTQYWGHYTAVAFDTLGPWVMVDPSGAGRAHLVQDTDLEMITNHLDPSAMRAANFEIDVNLSALAGSLLDPGTMVTAPLLRGVTNMVPGTAYHLNRRGAEIALWSPAALSNDCSENGYGFDGDRLRHAVDLAVTQLAGAGASLIELSGGLDSSILAGTMMALGIVPRAVTVELIGGDVDEVHYAQATARRCAIQLDLGLATTFPDYAAFMDVGQAAHPYMYGVDDAFANAVIGSADGIDRILTGQGGDAVFYQPATPLTTIDRYRALGIRSGWRSLLDDARRTRASIWHHILPVARDRLRGTPSPQDELADRLLTRQARAARTRFVHPWCVAAHALPPGRRLQMLMLANSLIFHSARPIDLGRPLVHPLLTQPVLESVLAVPTWRLASGRLDRGLARAAFADRLHPDVVARRSKGEAAAYYSRAAVANLPLLRERLLGGALVKAGIIDAPMMEQVLTPDYLFYSLDYRALVLHAACEAWLKAWSC